MLGKTFKGLTDAMLRLADRALAASSRRATTLGGAGPPRAGRRDRLRRRADQPALPGRVALRFARVLRYRPDKRADEADTVETVRALHTP